MSSKKSEIPVFTRSFKLIVKSSRPYFKFLISVFYVPHIEFYKNIEHNKQNNYSIVVLILSSFLSLSPFTPNKS